MYCTLTSSWLLAPGLNLTMLPTEYPEVDTTRTFLSPALCDPDVSADAETASPTPLAGLLWSLAPCWPYNADGSSCTPMGSMVPSGAGAVVVRAPPASISARSTRGAIACGRGAKSVGPRGRKEAPDIQNGCEPRALGPPLWAAQVDRAPRGDQRLCGQRLIERRNLNMLLRMNGKKDY